MCQNRVSETEIIESFNSLKLVENKIELSFGLLPYWQQEKQQRNWEYDDEQVSDHLATKKISPSIA